MERIVATITPGDTGSPVVKLQDALLALLDRQVIRALDALNLPTLEDLKRLTEDLRRERAASSFGAATVQLLMYFQIQEGLGDNLGGVVEEQTAAKLNEHLNAIGVLNNPEPAAFRVYGTLTGADGHPLPGATIVAVDVDLRRSEVLGQTKTDSKGDYEVRYTASQFTRAEKARADLVVRALLGDEKVAESKILFNATPEARIDLSSTNSYGPSEFEQLDRELAPLLDGTSPSDLMDSDVAFLAGETGRDIEQWRMFVQAQHSRVAHDQIPCEAFYGWFRLGQPTEWETLTSRPPSTLRQALQTALQRRLVPQGLADRIDEIIHALPNSAREQLQGLGSAIQLPKAALDRLTRHADSIDTIDDQILDRMVSGGELEHRHAQAIGLNLSLQRLAGGESSSIAATLQNTLPSHEPLQAARDLARLDVKDWEEGLEKATVPLPGGMTRGDQARAIVHEVAAAFPREVFEAQATRIPRNLNVHLERLKPLIDRDRGILGRALQEGDLRGIDAQGQEALREAHDTVRRLTRRHPGLQLHDVLSKSPDLGKAAVAVEERIGWMRKTFEMNPDIDFLRINFLPDSPDVGRLKFEGLSEAARDMVVANIKSTQRIQALAGNVAQTGLLMQAGYSSAASVARTSVRELVANVGLSESDAVVYQAEARGIANDAALMWMGLHAVAAKAATPAVLPPTDNGFFEKLPGYAALFGSADSCQCRDCQSVLSPAAYFVDLMHYIEEYILKPSFGLADPPTDKLHLRIRRPDLWDKVELTCDSTAGYLPYLDIINEVLEEFIKKQKLFVDSNALYRELANRDLSLREPFNWPLEQIDTYLEHFGIRRADIAEALHAPEDVLIGARLGLSAKERQIITTPRVDTASDVDWRYFVNLFRLYSADLNFRPRSPDDLIDTQSMQALMRVMELSHETCEALLTSAFVNADGSNHPPVTIVTGIRNPTTSVQNDTEVVKTLTLRRLDRVHRFLRLWRRLPWTIAELDYVLARLESRGLAHGIDRYALEQLSELREAQRSIELPVDELLALVDAVPTRAIRDSVSLFDRRFNPDPLATQSGHWPPPAVPRYVHASLNTVHPGTTLPEASVTDRLLRALQLNDQDLLVLIGELSKPLKQQMPDQSIELNEANLGLLYRHALAARVLKVPMATLFALLKVAPSVSDPSASDPNDHVKRIRGLGDFVAVSDFHYWRAGSGFKLEEIGYLLGGTAPSDLPSAADLAQQLVAAIRDEKSLDFVDTVFTQVGLSEKESRLVVESTLIQAANDGKAFERQPDGKSFRLRASFDPHSTTSVLTIDPSIQVPDIQAILKRLLRGNYGWDILNARLSAKLSMVPEKLAEILALARSNMTLASTTLVTEALQGKDRGPLDALVTAVLRYSVLFSKPIFDANTLAWVRAPLPQVSFDLKHDRAVEPQLTVQAIKRVATYALLATGPDDAFSDTSAPSNQAALQDVITASTAATDKQLAQALRVDEPAIGTLRAHLGFAPSNAFDLLSELGQVLDLSATLGLDGETLGLAVSDASDPASFDKLALAASGMIGAFRRKYPTEAAFLEKVEPFQDKLRGRRRDALVDYMTTEWPVPFASASELYQYFLLDVQLEGCARTSRLVAAISSLQLYVQRVLMNLEHNEISGAFFGNSEKLGEWEWRKHYRVWEANRKVFLYPENYIEPELRDDKTPLFKELEDTLLQQEITEQHVLDAYGRYLAGFGEVATLSVAGTYLETTDNPPKETLHIFAVTQTEPPIYYYRTIEALDTEQPSYGSWRKLELRIPVRRVSPVVYLGRLHVFWVEITTRSKTDFENGGSKLWGYIHKLAVSYSYLRLDGTWSAPQKLSIDYGKDSSGITSASARDSFILVPDPLDDGDSEHTDIKTGLPWFPVISVPTLDASIPRYDQVPHADVVEGYTLRGAQWELAFPYTKADQLFLTLRNCRMTGEVDVALNRLSIMRTAAVPSTVESNEIYRIGNANQLWEHTPMQWDSTAMLTQYAARTVATMRHADADSVTVLDPGFPHALLDLIFRNSSNFDRFGIPKGALLTNIPEDAEVSAVNGSKPDVIVETEHDLYLIHERANTAHSYRAYRIGTFIGDQIQKSLAIGGISGLLSTASQLFLREDAWKLSSTTGTPNLLASGSRDPFTGASQKYLQEIFFQVPFLIANHNNGQQDFAAAQRWYHFIFNPMATDNPSSSNSGDRPWRYRGFRNLAMAGGLREMLRQPEALAAYRKDPFNPHAIARLRPSAYQKSIVMKYIDNLLDWGDDLFSQFTMESVNEATMLYMMASNILGPRPAELGPCGEGSASPKTYGSIRPALDADSDFLIELEPITGIDRIRVDIEGLNPSYVMDVNKQVLVKKTSSIGVPPVPDAPETGALGLDWNKVGGTYWTESSGTSLSTLYGPLTTSGGGSPPGGIGNGGTAVPRVVPGNVGSLQVPGAFGGTVHRYDSYLLDVKYGLQADRFIPDDRLPPKKFEPFELVLTSAKAIFCIPENKELRAYWDRVEDRLYKIRNCMDISGVRRRLDLFSPEIDPHMLVRIKAAGLSLEDVLEVTTGNLPPYRFVFLIEKAKQYASTVQNFGAQLLSAIEKRDTEEMTRLRAVHEQNLLKLKTEALQLEIDSAEDAAEALRRQKAAAEYRQGHFASLIAVGLSGRESTQQSLQATAGGLRGAANLQQLLAAILYLLPDIGAPTAMKYGGTAIGNGGQALGSALNSLAAVCEIGASGAGLEATFARRDEEWKHQLKLAEHELSQIEKQITAAGFKKEIAESALKVHQKSIEQTEEAFDLMRDRFANLARYTKLSRTLHSLHRLAFNSAFSMARLAEQGYRFERPDDKDSSLLSSSYWDAENMGLLAGDRLLLDLQQLERRFIETNYRTLEIEQSFSLTQLAPRALLSLRELGSCKFTVPEAAFDLTYPGHYRRRIKAVRISIPCVTGPHLNVGATLRLTGSRLRQNPRLTDALTEVPLRHTTVIATSGAQNDAGVFEFSFRDERFMPFEGAGAVSDWTLELPAAFRTFDYRTISDVILRISYTAEQDDALKATVESAAATAVGTLRNRLGTDGMPLLLSLRYDAPDAWRRLVTSPVGTIVPIELGERHLPATLANWLRGRAVTTPRLSVGSWTIVLVPQAAVTPTATFSAGLGQAVPAQLTFGPMTEVTGLYQATMSGAVTLEVASSTATLQLRLDAAGNITPSSRSPSAVTIDETKLRDVILMATVTTV